jgi:hypothetical protein
MLDAVGAAFFWQRRAEFAAAQYRRRNAEAHAGEQRVAELEAELAKRKEFFDECKRLGVLT